jgi:hypothetical protein
MDVGQDVMLGSIGPFSMHRECSARQLLLAKIIALPSGGREASIRPATLLGPIKIV